ncbi:MAG TPA: maleylacetate reductase [Kofleriaceae bacterium]
MKFVYNALPARIVFGEGTLAQLRDEVSRLRATQPFVVAGRHHAEMALSLGMPAFTQAAMHTPVEVTARALSQLGDADCVIAIGGGSAIGLSKAIALRTDLPQIAVPTTYAGSEVTAVLGQTENGEKTTTRDPKIVPEVVIYDVALTLSLPRALTVTSGLNAMAHAVEALYAAEANPITSAFAEQALAAFAHSLPTLVEDPTQIDARGEALFGAWTAGTCLGSVGMGLHHKLCHVLGGSFGLPHSETHAVILPYATRYNLPAVPQAMARIAHAIDAEDGDAANGLRVLAEQLGAPTALKDLGMAEADLDRAAELAISGAYPNPRPIDRAKIRELLGNAWQGAWS